MLSIARIKDELPDVTVQIGRKIYRGRLTGRTCDFPTVTVSLGHTVWHATYSWQAICRAVEFNTPLAG
mgnify:CR=1 FL=1